MRKDQIEATKLKAIEILRSNVSNQSNNGFGTLMAQAIGVEPSIIIRLKNETRIMTLERALAIIEAHPQVLKKLSASK